MLEPSYYAFDVSADLWKNRHLLLPITRVSIREQTETKGKLVPIVSQVQNMLLCADCDFLKDLLAGVFADVVLDHDAVCLLLLAWQSSGVLKSKTCLWVDDSVHQVSSEKPT